MKEQFDLEYVAPCAGVVLLEPYYLPLFDKLELLDRGQFINQKAQERAVYILQYLASGDKHPSEPDLVVMKVLCGLSPSSILRMQSWDPSEVEEEIIQSLLAAALEHWSDFGKAPTEALQSSFLSRPGILLKKEDNWEIEVEKAPYDVILKTLPWGFSPVNPPWLKHSIQVTWDKSS